MYLPAGYLHRSTEQSELEGNHKNHCVHLWMAHTGVKPWPWCYQHQALTNRPCLASEVPEKYVAYLKNYIGEAVIALDN